MHPQTLVLESVDASTDSKNIFWVCGCIRRLWYKSLWMHPQTLKLESVDASTDSKSRVGGCIHRLYLQSRWMHPPTHEIWLIIPTVHWLFRAINGLVKITLVWWDLKTFSLKMIWRVLTCLIVGIPRKEEGWLCGYSRAQGHRLSSDQQESNDREEETVEFLIKEEIII